MPGDRKSQGPERRSGSPRSASGADRHDRSRRNDNQSGQEAQQLTATTQSSAHPSEKYPSYLKQGSEPYQSPYPDPLDRYGPHLSQNSAPYQSRYANPGSSPQTSERYSSYLSQGSAANPSHGYPSNQPQRQQQGYAGGPFGTNVERETQGTKEQAIPVSVSANLGPEQAATSGDRQKQKRLQPESIGDGPWTEGHVVNLMTYRRGHPYGNWTIIANALENGHDAGACQRKWDRMIREERKEEEKKARQRRKAKKEGSRTLRKKLHANANKNHDETMAWW